MERAASWNVDDSLVCTGGSEETSVRSYPAVAL